MAPFLINKSVLKSEQNKSEIHEFASDLFLTSDQFLDQFQHHERLLLMTTFYFFETLTRHLMSDGI